MKNYCIYSIVIIVLIGVSCNKHITKKSEFNHYNESRELEYYYAFTEATKLALFGRYKDALSLYNQCLNVKPQNSAVYFQISNIFLRTGQLNLAKKYALNAYEYDRQNYWYLMHLASIYQMQMNLDSSILMYKRIVKIRKDDFNSYFNLALLYKSKNKNREAIKICHLIEKNFGKSEKLYFLKHEIFIKLKKKKKAAEILIEGIRFFPDNIYLYGLLAEYYYDENKLKEARDYYEKIFMIDSTDEKAILSYADFLINNGEGIKAFSYYDKVIFNRDADLEDKILIVANFIKNYDFIFEHKEHIFNYIDYLLRYYKDKRIYALAVDFCIKNKSFEKAREYMVFLVKDNDNPVSYERLMYIDNYLKNYDSIVYYANKAISLFENNSTFYLLKGIAYMEKNDFINAIASLRLGLEKISDKKNEIAYFNYLAECYYRENNSDSSNYYFEKSLSIDNENLLIRNNYSYYLAERKKNLERAKELSLLTIKKEPENATYLDTYAWIMFKMNKYREALKYIEKAIKIEKNNAEILGHYGEILYMNNLKEKALDAFMESYLINPDNGIKNKIDMLKAELEID